MCINKLGFRVDFKVVFVGVKLKRNKVQWLKCKKKNYKDLNGKIIMNKEVDNQKSMHGKTSTFKIAQWFYYSGFMGPAPPSSRRPSFSQVDARFVTCPEHYIMIENNIWFVPSQKKK
jgi:hypothetical protein